MATALLLHPAPSAAGGLGRPEKQEGWFAQGEMINCFCPSSEQSLPKSTLFELFTGKMDPLYTPFQFFIWQPSLRVAGTESESHQFCYEMSWGFIGSCNSDFINQLTWLSKNLTLKESAISLVNCASLWPVLPVINPWITFTYETGPHEHHQTACGAVDKQKGSKRGQTK